MSLRISSVPRSPSPLRDQILPFSRPPSRFGTPPTTATGLLSVPRASPIQPPTAEPDSSLPDASSLFDYQHSDSEIPTIITCPGTPNSSQQSSISPQPNNGSQSMFQNLQNFSISDGTFINHHGNNTSVTNFNHSDNFMKTLLSETIRGAEYDSLERDPPPRCHPGTRIAIIERCLSFIQTCTDMNKLRWVFGAAGVGKSAIMQSIAESPLAAEMLSASVFFSVKGRNDGNKTIKTLSYQFAAKSPPYRQFIRDEVENDPALYGKAMSAQFARFIVKPFINRRLLGSRRILILIDGLDECADQRTQEELLNLISSSCLDYPFSPLVWIVASRPEPYIVSFFDQQRVARVYVTEEILVDTEEARQDIETFLRDGSGRVQDRFSRFLWPSQPEIRKIADASGGLFMYAETVSRYLGDLHFGSSTGQIDDILNSIDIQPDPSLPEKQRPMARLDAMYEQIWSKVSSDTKTNARKILLALFLVLDLEIDLRLQDISLVMLCDWLGMTCAEFYAAVYNLHSVLIIPERRKAHQEAPQFFHKSFIDYILDYGRSKLFLDIRGDALKLRIECSSRVVRQAPDGIDFPGIFYGIPGVGSLIRGSGALGSILLTWADDEICLDADERRMKLYEAAMNCMARGFRSGNATFHTLFCIRLLTSRFEEYIDFPYERLSDIVFDESRRDEFVSHGILKLVSPRVVNGLTVTSRTKLWFRRPARKRDFFSRPPDLWDPSCKHDRGGKWEGRGHDWSTEFEMDQIQGCPSCCQRFEQQLRDWRPRAPNYLVPVLFTSTGECFVEVEFDDDPSVWTYRIRCRLSLEERQRYGSIV